MKYTILQTTFVKCETLYLVMDQSGYYGIQCPQCMYHERTNSHFWEMVSELFPKMYERLPEADRVVELTDTFYPSLQYVTA